MANLGIMQHLTHLLLLEVLECQSSQDLEVGH